MKVYRLLRGYIVLLLFHLQNHPSLLLLAMRKEFLATVLKME